MASTGFRSLNRTSLSSIRSYLARSRGAARSASSSREPASAAATAASPSARRFPSLSRFPVELGSCSGPLYPLHSAVAVARLISCLSSTSRSCRALSHETGLSAPR